MPAANSAMTTTSVVPNEIRPIVVGLTELFATAASSAVAATAGVPAAGAAEVAAAEVTGVAASADVAPDLFAECRAGRAARHRVGAASARVAARRARRSGRSGRVDARVGRRARARVAHPRLALLPEPIEKAHAAKVPF